MRGLHILTAALMCTLGSTAAYAKASYSAGYTGRPPAEACEKCHGGGAAPSIALTGPVSLNPGETGDYTAIVSGGANTKTFGAAVDGVALINPVGANMFSASGEVFSTHDTGASATFRFKVVAPTAPAFVTIYAMALASNGSGTGGDADLQLTKVVQVGSPSVDAGSTTDAGAPAKDGGTPSSDAGTSIATPESDGGTASRAGDAAASAEEDAGAAEGPNALPVNNSDGCSFRSGPNNPHNNGWSGVVLTAFVLLGRRRRAGSQKNISRARLWGTR